MNKIPAYFRQEHHSACSLAVLRMVLATSGREISEQDLIQQVLPDYGPGFKNIWNPTIAKLACSYGIPTTMVANWPLFQSNKLRQALAEYGENAETFEVSKYEHSDDSDHLPEPLPLAYKEVFSAINLGCVVEYGEIGPDILIEKLRNQHLVQTSVKLKMLYPDEDNVGGFHSILIYAIDGDNITYHDSARRAGLRVAMDRLIASLTGTGAILIYKAPNSA